MQEMVLLQSHHDDDGAFSFKRLELIMQTARFPEMHRMPHDDKDRRFKRSSAFLLSQLIIGLTSTPLAHAQSSTTCTGSSSGSCVDLYNGTISAINAVGYQPQNLAGLASTTNGAQVVLQKFSGGVLNGGTMAFSENSGTPGESVAAATWVYNCPTATSNATGTIEMAVSVSNSTTITSDSSVSNSSSSFNQGENTVSLSYTSPPSPYGTASASDVMSYTWGSTYDTSSTTSSSNTTTNSAGATTTYPVSYNVPPGYATTVSLSVATNVYSGVNWSAPVTLTSPSNAALNNMQYTEQFINPFPPSATMAVNYNGSSVNANIWYAPLTISCVTNGADSCVAGSSRPLIDPTGQYTYWPTQYGTLGGWGITAPGVLDQIYWEGAKSGSGDTIGMNLVYSLSETDGSYLYGTENSNTSNVVWNPKVTQGGFLALLENGNLAAYSSTGSLLWSTNAGKGVLTPQTLVANPTPTVSQLLPSNNGQAFIASGTYSATSYSSDAQAGTSGLTPMTSQQISTYCSGSSTSGTAPVSQNNTPNNTTTAWMSPEIDAGYTLMNASFNTQSQGAYVLAQNDDRNRRDRRDERRIDQIEHSPAGALNGVQNDPAARDTAKTIKKAVDGDSKRKSLGKLKYIKGPIVLRKEQFYTANLPGFKVMKVVVKSDSMTNYSGFVPGNSQLDSNTFAGESRKVKLKVGNHMKTEVKPRSSI